MAWFKASYQDRTVNRNQSAFRNMVIGLSHGDGAALYYVSIIQALPLAHCNKNWV